MKNPTAYMAAIFIGLALACGTVAAPRQNMDELEGEKYAESEYRSAIIVLVDEAWVTYWLVFTSEEVEMRSRKIPFQTKVKAKGTFGKGGKLRYFIVSSIEPIEEGKRQ
jgi:hypothetical protein